MSPPAGQGLFLFSEQTYQHDQRLCARGSAGEIKVGAAVRIRADSLKKPQCFESLSRGGFICEVARSRLHLRATFKRLKLRHTLELTPMIYAALQNKPHISCKVAALIILKSAGNNHGVCYCYRRLCCICRHRSGGQQIQQHHNT